MDQTIQISVGIAVVISSLTIAAIFWWVASRTQPRVEYSEVTKAGYDLRRKYFWTLLLVSCVLGGVGIYLFPYPSTMEARVTEPPFVVKVKAGQFYWDLSEDELPTGLVRFDVTSVDVNHGLGIYGEEGRLMTQVQAMPDYVNKLYVNFTKPGTYSIWCLEYCGVAHHVMRTEFEVK